MKKSLLFLAMTALFITQAFAEYRIWEDVDGNVWEGEFETLSAGEVVMHDQAGKRIRIKPLRLCKADQLYLEKVVPPKLSIDVSKTTDSGKSSGSTEQVRCVATIKQADTRPYTGELTAVLLTVGADIRTRSSSTVNRKQFSFKLPDIRGEAVQFKGGMVSFKKTSNKTGTAYYGYILAVWDKFGNAVAIKSNRDSLAEKGKKLARPRKSDPK